METLNLDKYKFRTDYQKILEFKRSDGEWENMLGKMPNYALALLYRCIELEIILDRVNNQLPNGIEELIGEYDGTN